MRMIGEAAALGTALSWTVSAMLFESASRRIGALSVNLYKVISGFFILAIFSAVTRGMPFPLDATAQDAVPLVLSGIIGFVIADMFLFNAYILIGARVSMLFSALSPAFTALFGFLFLGEMPRSFALFGMALVIGGIAIVVLSKPSKFQGARTTINPALKVKGYVFALCSSIGQAGGVIFSKIGLASGYNAVAATQIRLVTAIFGFFLVGLLTRKAGELVVAWKDGQGMVSTLAGSVFGPALGVSLSLFAIQNTDAATASTLIALTPVLIIPPAIIFKKERPGWTEIAGAILAVAGTALFFA